MDRGCYGCCQSTFRANWQRFYSLNIAIIYLKCPLFVDDNRSDRNRAVLKTHIDTQSQIMAVLILNMLCSKSITQD